MQRSVFIRLSVIILLVATLGGLVVAYGSLGPDPAAGAYPSAETLVTEYDRYVGEQVVVGGTVVATAPVRLRTSTAAGPFEVTVRNLERSVNHGDSLRTFGIAREGREIDATRTIVVESNNLWFTYAVSALSGCWVLVRGIRHWRVDRTDWTLEPRQQHPPCRHGTHETKRSLGETTGDTRDGRDA